MKLRTVYSSLITALLVTMTLNAASVPVVNVNTASAAQIAYLPGIGSVPPLLFAIPGEGFDVQLQARLLDSSTNKVCTKCGVRLP
jgi:hypothetical protein